MLSRTLPPRQAQRFVRGLLLILAGLFLIGLIGVNLILGARLNAMLYHSDQAFALL